MGRIERDSLGEVEVPDGALWQAQTQRALENFAGLSGPVDPRLVRALASIKAAAARHHPDLAPETAARIAGAAEQIARGEHADQFPVDVFQTGSGTSTNMNLNEVIGTLAGAHPNDEVNAGQSSNDTFPTAIHLAAARAVVEDLQPALLHLSGTLRARAEEHRDTVKPGRTHLMDAVPITFGQELDGWASQAAYGVERLASVLPRVCELPLGGTAVGTGLNAPRGFAAAVIADLAGSTGLPLTEARDHVEAQGARDSLVELSGVLRTVAVGLYKTANDLRLLSSRLRAITGSMTLSSRAPAAPPKAIAASLPITCATTWQTASGTTGLTLPGMMLDPGCRSGRCTSASPVAGPLESSRRSLAVL